jgi:hypothetical protein
MDRLHQFGLRCQRNDESPVIRSPIKGAPFASAADANVGSCELHDRRKYRQQVRASAGRRHVPRLPFVIPRHVCS